MKGFKVVGVAALAAGLASTVHAAVQQWMDYFQPTPIISPLSSTCWGAAQVGPRDQSNGLEDKTMKSYNYWDGGIIKDEATGTYHMFASRWGQSYGHNGWMSDSHCVHATSSNLYGPYTDKGLCFTDNGGMCHNVNALKLKPGDTCGKQFAITCSGSVPGSGRVYGADSLDGPWTYLGDLKLDQNGYNVRFSSGDNFRTILRPDGQYECINATLGLADNVLGPYKAQLANDFVHSVAGSPTTNMEDPNIFYAGNQYHVLYNCWSEKKAYFYSSTDGIHNWKLEQGHAYDPTSNMVRYTDGTVNHWALLERPGLYLENGHVVAMTFAAINVPKDQDTANSGNGSKVIVVPIDGLSYDSGGPPGSVVTSGGAAGAPDAGSGSGGRGGSSGTTSSASGTGGAVGTGGATSAPTGGSGGTSSHAEGGAGGTSPGTSGANGTGGRSTTANPSGGAPGSGGGAGGSSSGGTSGGGSTGAGTASSGGVSSGGAGGSGGLAAAGGANGTGGAGSGGSSKATANSSGGAAGATPSPRSSSSGCTCAIGRSSGTNGGALLVLLALTIALVARRPKWDVDQRPRLSGRR